MGDEDHLYIIWTTDNVETAMNMVLTYGGNSMLNHWWEKVTIIVWGASQKLVASNPIVQDRIKELMEMGVFFSACQRCAGNLEVKAALEALGVETKYWGEPLTKLLKAGARIITI